MPSSIRTCIGIDLGGTKIKAVLVDAEGNILRRIKVGTPKADAFDAAQTLPMGVTGIDTGGMNMRGITQWGHTPYRPFDRMGEALLPFICRLAPNEHGFALEWFDHGSGGGHILRYRKMKSYLPWKEIVCQDNVVHVDGLEAYADYELRIARTDAPEQGSALRYVRTGAVPGVVVNYLHPADDLYAFSGKALCSPSLAKLPNGALLASMDVFEGQAPQNLTLIFRSDDNGQTWRYVTDLFPCYWGTLFVHRQRLYMFATETEYGNVMIAESMDEGKTWTKPSILFYGSGMWKASGWQHTPSAFVEHNGRLYTSIDYGAWSQGGHGICQMSVDADADLLESENWTVSEPLRYDPHWKDAPKGKAGGLLEGNIVAAPDGQLRDILRLQIDQCVPSHGLAVSLRVDAEHPEAQLAFDTFIHLPSGSNSKTHIVRDDVSGYYIGIGNICTDESTPAQRNVLAMVCSQDMIHWKVAKIELDYREMRSGQVGFQYIFFLIDGEDILYLSRTAMNNARNFHDANYQTFHRIARFRQYL